MTVPNSVCEYYRNSAVRRSVDELVQSLDGNSTPEISWEEARNYNKALLTAAQVRADFIEFLFAVWERSFGQMEPERLGKEYFDYETYSPEGVWDEKDLIINYYRNGDPEDGGRSDALGIAVNENNELYLHVSRYDEQEELEDFSNVELPQGWRLKYFEENGYLVNCSTNIFDFREDMAKIIERFSQDARTVVEYLLRPTN